MWAAPEILRGEKFNEKCDVFSFHVIFMEMITWDEPYPGLGSNEIMRRVALDAFRMEVPYYVPDAMRQVIELSSADDPTKRGTFTELMPKLEEWLENTPH